MKALYQHCSMAGSYYVPCTIVDSRPWTEDYMTSIERDFGKKIPTANQYHIYFFDSIEDDIVEKWVNEEYVVREKV